MENKKQKRGLAEEAAESILGPNPVIGLNRKSILNTIKTLVQKGITQPDVSIGHQVQLLKEFANILKDKSDLVPDERDKRFKDEAWRENTFYKISMQSYLALGKGLNQWVEDLKMDKVDEDRSKFVLSLFTEAVAPSNWITNPMSIKRAIDTGGKSWAEGVKHLLEDVVNNGGLPSKVSKEGFRIGKNLATSKGAIVFKNDVLELIQYQPATEKVYRRPLLLVPPQINKYYILDLSSERSFVEFLTQRSYQTFVISWRNPTKEHSMWDLETYVMAIEQAMDVVKHICRIKDINVWGACSGGITLSTTLAYLVAKKKPSVHAASFVVSMLDVSHISDTSAGLFVDDTSIELAREKSHRRGILKGEDMAAMFSWLRPNDLIWNYWVNNYLMGNEPPKFDVLYWNGDTTNLPASLHSDYLDLFKENYLTSKGGFSVRKHPIDLSTVDCEMYFVAGLTDHITPWKSCYQSLKLFQTKSTFVLGNKGHVQTLLNPVGNQKGKFYTNTKAECLDIDPEKWLEGAEEHSDTWWIHFSDWLEIRSEKQKTAPKKLGNKKYPTLYEAPGQYVFNQ